MTTQKFPNEHLNLLRELAGEICRNGSRIVQSMMSAKMSVADGLEFAPIEERMLTPAAVDLRRRVEVVIGCDVEVELLRVTGFVPPHRHAKCTAAIVRCNTEPSTMIEGLFMSGPSESNWATIEIGRVISVPAGMVHGMRANGTVNFISINAPPIDPQDVLMV